jgi:hypothetical protein
MQAQTTVQNRFINSITQADCIQVMRQIPANSVDFILTDPPYLVNYRDRSGRSIQNDVNADWLKPAMREAYRVLKMNRVLCGASAAPVPTASANAFSSRDRRQSSPPLFCRTAIRCTS